MSIGYRIVAVVVAGHFVAAFAALGMPPFFPLIVHDLGGGDLEFLAGWCYVLPSICLAISSPWWGRLADRYGHKRLLLRAQLGLAVSFLLAGFADNIWTFVLALMLQGLLGGTFGASSAYLATVASGEQLSRGLTLMQGSARAALVVAPLLLGEAVMWMPPLNLYRYLAFLPLLAALLIWQLPTAGAPASRPGSKKKAPPSLRALLLLQGTFVFGTVVTFPYFIVFAQTGAGTESTAVAGFLFGLPHLVYLVVAAPLTVLLRMRSPFVVIALAFVALLLSLLGQPHASSVLELGAWRLLMGLGMTAGFIGLHGLTALVAGSGQVGQTFGYLESGSKWAAVIAGFVAGSAVGIQGPELAFYLGAGALFAALAGLGVAQRRRDLLSIEGVN